MVGRIFVAKILKSNLELRDNDERHINELCWGISTRGREALWKSHREEPEVGSMTVLKCEHPLKPDERIHIFEGYHLQQFAYHSTPHNNIQNKEITRSKYFGLFDDKDILKDLPTPRNNQMSTHRPRDTLSGLAKLYGTTDFEVFLAFLKFCHARCLPLRVFGSNQDKLRKAIDDMEEYRSAELNKPESIGETIPLPTHKDDNQHQKYSLKLALPNNKHSNSIYFGNRIIKDVIGRDNEQKQLLDFLVFDDPEQQFFWFQLAGVGGQGKSRLALELVLGVPDGWNAGFLEEDEIDWMADKWRSWNPTQPHLIVIDYVVSLAGKVGQLFRILCKRRKEFSFPVRLLLIERQAWNRGVELGAKPTSIYGETFLLGRDGQFSEWFIDITGRYDGEVSEINESRFQDGALELRKLSEEVLFDVFAIIVKAITGKEIPPERIPNIQKILKKIDNQGRPLYAYFFAIVYASGADTSHLTQEQLLSTVLYKEQEKQWRPVFEKEPLPVIGSDTTSLRLALLATMIGELDCSEITRNGYFPQIDNNVRKQALALTGGSLSKHYQGASYKLLSLQPDILGEWFVLSNLQKNPDIEAIVKMAWAIAPEKMAGFIQRLVEDFTDHKATLAIIDFTDIESLDEDILQACSIALSWYFIETKRTIPTKIISALEKADQKGHPDASLVLALCASTPQIAERIDFNKSFRLLEKAAKYDQPRALALLGYAYMVGAGIDVPDMNKAVSSFKQAEKLGDTTGFMGLGVCYLEGTGVPKNFKLGEKYLKHAANAGVAGAISKLGIMYLEHPDISKKQQGLKLLQEADKQGEMNATSTLASFYEQGVDDLLKSDQGKAIQLHEKAALEKEINSIRRLAFIHKNGVGVPKNDVIAFKWFSKAAELGDPESLNELGAYFDNGNVVEKDYKKSFELIESAATFGLPQAMRNLGDRYTKGLGVGQNIEMAIFWYEKAIEKGFAPAFNSVGILYRDGVGIKQSFEKARAYFKRGAKQNDALSLMSLAFTYEYGQGIKQNLIRAFVLFKRAASTNNAIAHYIVASYFFMGKGIPKNFKKAVKYFRKAAIAGESLGMRGLAICYYKGLGVSKNQKLALRWFSNAVMTTDLDDQMRSRFFRGKFALKIFRFLLSSYAKRPKNQYISVEK
jgi:TPR repeat protein